EHERSELSKARIAPCGHAPRTRVDGSIRRKRQLAALRRGLLSGSTRWVDSLSHPLYNGHNFNNEEVCPMLCSEFDPNPHAIINPEDLIQPIPGFPEICVMVFSNHIAEMCLRRWGGEHIAQVKCCVGDMPIYRVIVDGTEVALSTPYVGGPAAATFIEEVWPLGGKYFVF